MRKKTDLNSIKTLLENLAPKTTPIHYDFFSFYDAIDLLDDSITLIRDNTADFSKEELRELKKIHTLVMKMTLRIVPKNENKSTIKLIDTTHDLAYLVNKYKLKHIFQDSICTPDLNNSIDYILSDSFKEDFPEYKELLESQEQSNLLFIKANERFLKNFGSEWEDISSLFVSPPSKIENASCFFYIEEFGETVDEHIQELLLLFAQQRERINKVSEILKKLLQTKTPKAKKPDKLVSPNNNPSKKVFGKTNSKSKTKESETPYYSVPGTSDEILEYRSLISSSLAKDIKVKDSKTLTGQLALVTSISDQKDRYKPMVSSPLNSFDMYVYSNTIACLRDYINTKVDIDILLTSFSGTNRIKEETDFTRSFVNSLMKMRRTSVFFEYKTNNKTVSILEPILSFTLTKETNDKTGKEKRYIELHKMPEFFEWAESLKQVISIPEKLFRVEYKKNGKISRLRQTKRNTLLETHLLEHISNFRYYFENKQLKDSEEEDSPERFSKILFETLYEVAEVKTKEERRDVSEIIEHCLEYWKECNLVDYRIETEAATGGRRYIAINLFYPKNPQLKLS